MEQLLNTLRQQIDAFLVILMHDSTTHSEWEEAARERGRILEYMMNLSPVMRDSAGCDPNSVICLL